MSVNFVPNRAGFTALALGPGARVAVTAEAEKGKAVAEALAVDFTDTGDYLRSFEVNEVSLIIGVYPRAAARLENTSDHAAAVEVGNAATRGNGHHVLSRTLDALAAG